MPSKGYPTLPQRQKKAQNNGQEVPDAHPGPDVRKRYVDAAKILELRGDWPTSLAIRFFGASLMGSLAFAIDPLARFRNSFRAVSDEKRRVDKETQVVDFTAHGLEVRTVYSNCFVDDPNEYPERVVSSVTSTVERTLWSEQIRFVSFLSDSVQSQRYKGQEYGTMEMLKDLSSERQNRITYTTKEVEIRHIETSGPPYKLYERTEVETYWFYDGPIVFPVGSWCDQPNAANLLATSKTLATDKLFSMLPNTLANRRGFNLFYQIAEFKDIPQLIKGVKDFANFVATIAHDPQLKFLRLDKALSDAYLTYLFGAKSLTDAVNSMMRLPAKLTKRMNYLMARNNKVSRGKAAISFDDSSWTYVSPAYATIRPPGCTEVIEDSTTVDTHFDIKCVVNQTLQFPEVLAPKFLDKNYREFIGLQPRLVDFYNLIPFSWLVDWFSGLGSYINMISTVNDDRFLINFGFMTVIMQPKFKSYGSFRIRDLTTHIYDDGSDTVEVESNIRFLRYYTKHGFTHQKRWSIADLDGSKTVDNKNGNLSDSQVSIIGALISKFTNH